MNLIERVKNIITSPNKEWDVIATETPDTGKIITGYVLPLAGAAALAAFIGYGLIGQLFRYPCGRNKLGYLSCSFCLSRCNCRCFFKCICY